MVSYLNRPKMQLTASELCSFSRLFQLAVGAAQAFTAARDSSFDDHHWDEVPVPSNWQFLGESLGWMWGVAEEEVGVAIKFGGPDPVATLR